LNAGRAGDGEYKKRGRMRDEKIMGNSGHFDVGVLWHAYFRIL
jgi:S-adenosylhomocysteine hydrolase